MRTKACYYVILLVYILLWLCQCTACHLTHSLIIMTDSYINMYKILDIALGIVHLETQKQVRGAGLKQQPDGKPKASLASRLFGRTCTFQFKRLPVLGSFVNGLFLAALLMSVAIEGIQTCFHASHSGWHGVEDEKSILLNHPVTYPAVLVGFAVVGIMMQWCSDKAHEMREDELDSESRWDLTSARGPNQAPVAELDAAKLEQGSSNLKLQSPVHSSLPAIDSFQNQRRRRSRCLGGVGGGSDESNKFVLNHSGASKRHSSSFESIPLDSGEPVKPKQMISLTSLRVAKDFEDSNYVNVTPPAGSSNDLEAELAEAKRAKFDFWMLIRYWISPFALTLCALVVYLINEELVTEIADAALAIMVVVLLFSASYPPTICNNKVKKASKILLLGAPNEVDLDRLRASIMSVSPLIQDISELNVWSLTARSKRVATCGIKLQKESIKTDAQLRQLLEAVRAKFLANNIKCSTIEPVFCDNNCSSSASNPTSSCHDATTANNNNNHSNNTCCAH